MEMLGFVMVNWEAILSAFVGVVGLFAIIATATPNQSDNKIAQFLLEIINFLGANFGKAGNAPTK